MYRSVARHVNADPGEIALAENATVAWQWAFYALGFKSGDGILTTAAEYAANYLSYLRIAKRTGAVIDLILDDADGRLDPQALEMMIDDRVRVIAITWAPTNGGLVNPAADVGRIANLHGIPYLLDACQAVGQLPLDVAALGCGMLALTERKFLRGPLGTGFLYMNRALAERTEPAMIDMSGATSAGGNRYTPRTDARRFETWESNYVARLGLGAAIEEALAIGISRIERRVKALATTLRALLDEMPGVTVRDFGPDPAAIVTFTLDRMDAASVAARLADRGINVSVIAEQHANRQRAPSPPRPRWRLPAICSRLHFPEMVCWTWRNGTAARCRNGRFGDVPPIYLMAGNGRLPNGSLSIFREEIGQSGCGPKSRQRKTRCILAGRKRS